MITMSENLREVVDEEGSLTSQAAAGPYSVHVFTFDHVYDQMATQRRVRACRVVYCVCVCVCVCMYVCMLCMYLCICLCVCWDGEVIEVTCLSHVWSLLPCRDATAGLRDHRAARGGVGAGGL
jgi:hypothetical protein